MRKEDLNTFSKIGNALWMDPVYSERSAIETLAAVNLLDLTPERTLEKAATALLVRAKSEGTAANTLMNADFLSGTFFRLTLEERFLLVALHIGRWSYERLSRILKKTPDEIQEMSWSARLQLSTSLVYPSGPKTQGIRCPEYHSRRPWTQKFLDEEIESHRDQLFLQNHLLACASCSQALSRCRDVYFKIDKEISKIVGNLSSLESLERVMDHEVLRKYPSERSFLDSLNLFTRRWDVRVVLMAFLILLIYRFMNQLMM